MAESTKRVVRVFLSSPGDVQEQRATVREAFARLNADPLVAERCFLELVAWDNGLGGSVPLSATRTPQASVNDYVVLPRDCDLTVVLLWSRLGTPLPQDVRRVDGSAFESGTVWELEDASAARREVWIYRDLRRPRIEIDDPEEEQKKDQFRRLQAFVQSARNPDGSLRFGLHEYQSSEELRDWLCDHLRQYVRRTVPLDASAAREVPSPGPAAPRRTAAVGTVTLQGEDQIGRLIHLCDREDVRDLFTTKLRERVKVAKPRRPLLCVLPGGARQGHRGFLERIREYEVRSQLPGISPEHVVLVSATGKLPVGPPDLLGLSILRAIREATKDPAIDAWKDLQRWMAQEDRRILLLALEPTTDAVRGREDEFLRSALAWLREWIGKPAKPLVVMIACVRISTDSKLFGPAPEVEREQVLQRVGRFCEAAPRTEADPEVVMLPELPALTREDVENWLDHDVVRQLVGPRTRRVIEKIFDERAAWPMDDLRDRLNLT